MTCLCALINLSFGVTYWKAVILSFLKVAKAHLSDLDYWSCGFLAVKNDGFLIPIHGKVDLSRWGPAEWRKTSLPKHLVVKRSWISPLPHEDEFPLFHLDCKKRVIRIQMWYHVISCDWSFDFQRDLIIYPYKKAEARRLESNLPTHNPTCQPKNNQYFVIKQRTSTLYSSETVN